MKQTKNKLIKLYCHKSLYTFIEKIIQFKFPGLYYTILLFIEKLIITFKLNITLLKIFCFIRVCLNFDSHQVHLKTIVCNYFWLK